MKGSFISKVIIAFFAAAIIYSLFLMYRSEVHSPYQEVRAAIDIGSGTTNLKIATVETRTNDISKVIFQKSYPVAFQKSLSLSEDNTFDESIRSEGIKVFDEIKNVAAKHGAEKVIAIATSAFRTAKNGPEYAKEIEEKTGIDVEIVSQDQEGILGFYGAISKSKANPSNVVVWDIGGGSLQLTAKESSKFEIAKGEKASIYFKNALIEAEGHDIQKVQSPNPISEDTLIKGIAIAELIAEDVNQQIKDKLDNYQTQVFVIGNLFNHGLKPLVGNKEVMTQPDLRKAIEGMLNKTDEELGGGPLAEVKVSNAIYVIGFMDALRIREVKFVDVNNTDGALIDPNYWDLSDAHTEELQLQQ